MNTPLDDIFQQEKPISIEVLKQQQLQVVFEWITSFSVLFWAIALVEYFKTDWILVLKGVLLIGLFVVLVSTILSLILIAFRYKGFYHLWLLSMSTFNGLTILFSIFSLI